MPSATMQQTPIVPPRPSRSSEKGGGGAAAAAAAAGLMPAIPPRPSGRRIDRSQSPGSNRFAQSPFNDSARNKSLRPAEKDAPELIERPPSVSMPSVGQEGQEYVNLSSDFEEENGLLKTRSHSPEQTRTVGEELKLHAPKPSLPANAAKRQVQQVTRTDSDKAASYGFGRRSFDERSRSRDTLRKRPSTSLSTESHEQTTDDEHGIPEIGQRVPMASHLGDVQAPSPGPGAEGRNHNRKGSCRNLPPGSYGLHGHGNVPLDKLEKEYYQKHPELKEKEMYNPIHDRQNNYAMSRDDLNRLVRDTPNRQSASRLSGDHSYTPTDEVAFQASERFASRTATPRDSPAIKSHDEDDAQHNASVPSASGPSDEVIHVDDARHPEYRSFGDEDTALDDENNNAPILAYDEVQKNSKRYSQLPAVHPPPERHGSAFEESEAPSRPVSRPATLHSTSSYNAEKHKSTHLDDVEEYEPLFDDEAEKLLAAAKKAEESRVRHFFPSKDIWEDAPESVHYSAEVQTPEPEDPAHLARHKSHEDTERVMTPAQIFAQHQEELAEKQTRSPTDAAFSRSGAKPTWVNRQAHLRTERPAATQRFPSRDIWEDVPESQMHSATVEEEEEEEEGQEGDSKPQIPTRPVKKLSTEKPALPDRPKPKTMSSDEAAKTRPPVSERPKPQVPARPTKVLSGDAAGSETAAAGVKSKPPVPNRPVGGKIAALQAGFMSDLNKRLQLGPQPQKKQEAKEEELAEPTEKTPLMDARKSRARGPQRRAPAKAAESAPAAGSAPVLTFSMPQTSWTIDPDAGDVAVDLKEVATEEEVKGLPIDEPAAAAIEGEVFESEVAGEKPHIAAAEEPAVSDVPVLSEKPLDEEDEEDEDKDEEEPDHGNVDQEQAGGPKSVQQTLVANTAGESILETHVEQKGDAVEPIEVREDVKA